MVVELSALIILTQHSSFELTKSVDIESIVLKGCSFCTFKLDLVRHSEPCFTDLGIHVVPEEMSEVHNHLSALRDDPIAQ